MRELNDEETKYVQEKLLILLKAAKEACEKENIWYSLAYGSVLGAVRHDGFIPWDTDADIFIKLPDKEKFREAFNKHKPEGIRLKNHNLEKKCLQSHDTLIFEDKMMIDDIHLDIYPLVGAPESPKEQKKFTKYIANCDKIVRSKYVDLKQCKKKNKLFVFIVKCFDFFIPDKVLRKNIYNREHKYDFDNSKYLVSLSCYGKPNDCVLKDVLLNTTQHLFCDTSFNIPVDYDNYLRRTYGDDYMTPIKY